MSELLPTKASFGLDDPVAVEVRGLTAPLTVSLWRLAEKVAEVEVAPASPLAEFGRLAAGAYGVESSDGGRSALDVLERPLQRLRYGFVSGFAPGRDLRGLADNARRLHLNAIQFYDWMYRHADLLPPGEEFEDALGRKISLAVVRDLVQAVRAVGSLPLGYAAVYAVGAEHWEEWKDAGLFHAEGSPWMLADFLWNVDPSDERWLRHFTGDLRRAVDEVGFAGFHLDQFGAPKRASRADGQVVDLAEAFTTMIERVRAALPDARLVFNNVNDFPVWATAGAPQDAVYIEVWSPHDELGHLAGLVAKARALAPGKPVSLAAYLSIFARDDDSALQAMRLELATVFSHGATCLLHGEEDAILIDPYYVRHERMDARARDVATAYYDFAVRYGDLLFDEAAVDVTRTHSGGEGKEVRVEAPVPVATDCVPGAIWARVVEAAGRQVVSLIDLTAQADVAWDSPKQPGAPVTGAGVAFERVGAVDYFFAAPEDSPAARRLQATVDGGHDVVEVPPFSTWALVWAEQRRS